MAVLLVTQDFPPDRGGIQTYCRELAHHLTAQGERGAGAVPDAKGGPGRNSRLPAGGIAVDRLRMPGRSCSRRCWRRCRRYLRAHPEIGTIVYAQWQSALWQLVRARGWPAGTGGCAWCTGAS